MPGHDGCGDDFNDADDDDHAEEKEEEGQEEDDGVGLRGRWAAKRLLDNSAEVPPNATASLWDREVVSHECVESNVSSPNPNNVVHDKRRRQGRDRTILPGGPQKRTGAGKQTQTNAQSGVG